MRTILDDTIAAISTPLGEGGIGIVRISGKDAIEIVENIFKSPKGKKLTETKSHRVVYGYIVNPLNGEKIDEVIVSIMKAPYSYTREDVVEINCHGGMITLRKTLELVISKGARLAEPGEFTKRAFLNGRIDLSQAEAVLDLIRSKTEESRKIALEQLQGNLSNRITTIRDNIIWACANLESYIDFPEDEIEPLSKEEILNSIENCIIELEKLLKTYDEARFFREGLLTAIVGRPNVGKSSLLNALLQKDRAIVTDIPGTTRDIIEEYLNIKGLPIRVIDTAGIRDVDNIAEKEGVKRSIKSIENSDLVIALFDISEPLTNEDFEVIEKVKDKNTIYVLNKIDLTPFFSEKEFAQHINGNVKPIIKLSAIAGEGIDELKEKIIEVCIKDWKEEREGVVVSNIRHKIAIENSIISLKAALYSIKDKQPLEITSIELRSALDKLGEIIGVVTTEDILNIIFENFCIGK